MHGAPWLGQGDRILGESSFSQHRLLRVVREGTGIVSPFGGNSVSLWLAEDSGQQTHKRQVTLCPSLDGPWS